MIRVRLTLEEIEVLEKQLGIEPKNYVKPLTEAQAKALLKFDVDTENGRVYKYGFEKGRTDENGYVRISLPSGRHAGRAHIVWWKAHGYWPTKTIDHIDRDRINDRISNLKEATMREQAANSSRHDKNLTKKNLLKS